MNFLELKASGKTEKDHRVIENILKESEYTFLRNIGEILSIPVNNHNYYHTGKSTLLDWEEEVFGAYAAYGFFLYCYKYHSPESRDMERVFVLLMNTLVGSLIEEKQEPELDKTLDKMRRNIGISKEFYHSLVTYLIARQEEIARWQFEYPCRWR